MIGHVEQIVGLTIETRGPQALINELCYVESADRDREIPCEVVGFRGDRMILMPLADMTGIGPGSSVYATGGVLQVQASEALLGRVLDGLGHPIDGKGIIESGESLPIYNNPPHALQRPRITESIATGIRAIDGMLTCGKGQRIGIFAGSGVGKSTLLGMIARNTNADVNVVALVGERGREVNEFIERDLTEAGLARSVVVVATSDQPALLRLKAAFVATTIAEYFRDRGLDVMLMMDSVTRFAMAQRDVGLSMGEPPATRGYTPSVFSLLPKLMERAGMSDRGSITGFYSVLVEGDDMNEPVTDASRSILDGHIVLSRRLTNQGHYPAIDVLASISRLMTEVTSDNHRELAIRMRSLMATYSEAEDLINIGAYVAGSNPAIDEAVALHNAIVQFLQQGIFEQSTPAQSLEYLAKVLG
ncbi:MAG: flagellar protein export ATPase FliI [Symbiobacteriaceae bacterium]|nr:flagellar protein export ATPase FliI [Symbiobacteriaceae bacterium]